MPNLLTVHCAARASRCVRAHQVHRARRDEHVFRFAHQTNSGRVKLPGRFALLRRRRYAVSLRSALPRGAPFRRSRKLRINFSYCTVATVIVITIQRRFSLRSIEGDVGDREQVARNADSRYRLDDDEDDDARERARLCSILVECKAKQSRATSERNAVSWLV